MISNEYQTAVRPKGDYWLYVAIAEAALNGRKP